MFVSLSHLFWQIAVNIHKYYDLRMEADWLSEEL